MSLVRTSTPRGKLANSRGVRHELCQIWYRIPKMTMWRSSGVILGGKGEMTMLLLLLFAFLMLPLLLIFILLLLPPPPHLFLTLLTWILLLVMLTLIELPFLPFGFLVFCHLPAFGTSTSFMSPMLTQFANESIQPAETHQFPTYSASLIQMPWVGGTNSFFF